MTLDGFPVTDWLGSSSGGITGSSPEYQAREAARFAHYKFEEFMQLPNWEKASIVGHFRSYHGLQAAISRRKS